MKKIFNKGPARNVTCNCAINELRAENDYVSMLEMFINNCYPSENFKFFGMDKIRAEKHVDKNMSYLGYNQQMVDRAYFDTIIYFADSEYGSWYVRFNNFVNRLLRQPHKDYANYYSNNFRFVLTLILGYLNKLKDDLVLIVDDPMLYFKVQILDTSMKELRDALDKTRSYVEASNDSNLAQGMRMVEQWFEEVAKENIPAKELTIADIEKQLGYKIKIVGDDK